MNFRIIKKNGIYYVQEKVRVINVYGMCDMSHDEWKFVRKYIFFKREFSYQKEVEVYIESRKAGCEDYEVIGEY